MTTVPAINTPPVAVSNGHTAGSEHQESLKLKPTAGNDDQNCAETKFLRAARVGDCSQILELLQADIDINTCNSNGLSALHMASKEGHTEVVAELLRRGMEVDVRTRKGNTALLIASLAGQEAIVKILVEHGASVNVQSPSGGFSLLYMAAQENHEGVVRYLLAHGANQTLETEDGFIPLAVALQQGHGRIVALLTENNTASLKLPAMRIAAANIKKKDNDDDHKANVVTSSKSGSTPESTMHEECPEQQNLLIPTNIVISSPENIDIINAAAAKVLELSNKDSSKFTSVANKSARKWKWLQKLIPKQFRHKKKKQQQILPVTHSTNTRRKATEIATEKTYNATTTSFTDHIDQCIDDAICLFFPALALLMARDAIVLALFGRLMDYELVLGYVCFNIMCSLPFWPMILSDEETAMPISCRQRCLSYIIIALCLLALAICIFIPSQLLLTDGRLIDVHVPAKNNVERIILALFLLFHLFGIMLTPLVVEAWLLPLFGKYVLLL